jgi:diguanylate cyclase (GGDEF)-like protein
VTYIIIGAVLLLSIILSLITYHSGKAAGLQEGREDERKELDVATRREILARDQEIQELHARVDRLDELNSRYLSFMFKIPTTVQRLNSTMKFEEIISSVVDLVKDAVPTNLVEIYMLDPNNILKRVDLQGEIRKEESSYAIGEGLIGRAGQDRIIRFNGLFNRANTGGKYAVQTKSRICMATPIVFKDRLLGVIGIGNADPTRDENNLMKMIADIAAVTLVNITMLGEAKYKANTDSLTGISNRNYFLQMSQTVVEKAIREGTPISIFLFDIDNFKHYNDTNGHDAGDKLLIELSQIVSGITRKSAVFARYGGEEFIVMLPGISKEEAFIYANRVREQISGHPFQHREKQPLGCVSISGGVASFPMDGGSIHKVIQFADASLYQAKAEGRNRILLHKPYFFSDQDKGLNEVSPEPSSLFKQ